jgi:peptidyl-prolyl cis-trans isomerase C
MHRFFTIIGSLFLLALFVQGTATAEDKDVVAKIGDKTITLFDLDKIISYADPDKQKTINSNPQMKEKILRQFVQSIVISGLARKEGFDNRPEIKEFLDFYTNTYIANEFIKKEIPNKINVPEEDIIKYYDSHFEEFKVPETVRASHILVRVDQNASENDKLKAKQKAEDIFQRLTSGEDFAKVATEVSDDPSTNSKGGDLGFFPKGMMVKSFEDMAFALKPGTISSVVGTQYGYHIIKTVEKRPSYIASYDNVKARIRQDLLQRQLKSKTSEFLDKALKDAGVEIYPKMITGTN